MTRQKEVYILLIAVVCTLCIFTIIMLFKVDATNREARRLIDADPARRGMMNVSRTL